MPAKFSIDLSRPERSGDHIHSCHRIPGQGHGLGTITGHIGGLGGAQHEAHPVTATQLARIGNLTPQGDRLVEMAQGLHRRRDRAGLVGRPQRRRHGTGQVVGGQAMIGKLGRGAGAVVGQQPSIGGM